GMLIWLVTSHFPSRRTLCAQIAIEQPITVTVTIKSFFMECLLIRMTGTILGRVGQVGQVGGGQEVSNRGESQPRTISVCFDSPIPTTSCLPCQPHLPNKPTKQCCTYLRAHIC